MLGLLGEAIKGINECSPKPTLLAMMVVLTLHEVRPSRPLDGDGHGDLRRRSVAHSQERE